MKSSFVHNSLGNNSDEKDDIELKTEWLQQNLCSGPTNGPNSLRIYREDVRALLITEFGAPISDLEVGLLLRQGFPGHIRRGKYYLGIGANGKHPTDVAVGLHKNPQSLLAATDNNRGGIPNMLKPMKKRAIEAWRQENGRQKPTTEEVVPPERPPQEPIVRPWPQQAIHVPSRSEVPPRPPPGAHTLPHPKDMWHQMLVRMKPPTLAMPPLDHGIRAPPGQPPGLIPGLPPGLTLAPGLPPGIPGATSMVPGMVAMPTPVSSMAAISASYSSVPSMSGMSPALNTQSGARVDGILGINRAASRGRKRSVGVERPGVKRRRVPDKDQGMIDLAAAGGMTPHQRELSKIQPIILNFEIPTPKVSPPETIEQRLASLSDTEQNADKSRDVEERLAQEARRNPDQRPGHIPVHPNIVVTSYPDGVPRLQLPQPGTTAPAPGHIPPSIQSNDERMLSPRRGVSPGRKTSQLDPFKKPDIGKFEAVAGAKCFICRLSIPPGSKDFPSRPTNIVTCSRCKKVAFGGSSTKTQFEPIPKFPTACNASLAEKMQKLRKAQAFVRMKKRLAKQRAMGIHPGKKASASAPSSPAPRSPMPLSPASLPPRSPGTYMPKSPLPSSASSLPPPSPSYMPPSPASLPPRSPGGAPPLLSHSKPSHCLQPRSPMSLPPRSPLSMPASPQAAGYHSYPASPNASQYNRPPRSPVFAPRLPSPAGSMGSIHGSPDKQTDMLNPNAGFRSMPSPRHPQLFEQSPASSTSSERLSLPPGREQDDTTIRALLQLGRPADRHPNDPSGVPVVVLQRGEAPSSRANLSPFPQPLLIPSGNGGEATQSSMPNTPTMISAGGHLIPVMSLPPTSSSSAANTVPPGYPTGAFPYLVQPFSPSGAIGTPGSEKTSPVPKLSNMRKPGFGQPQYIPTSTISPRLNVPKQPHYISSDGKYMMESQSDNANRHDSIVIVGTNCAGSSSITVGNDLKDPYASVPPSLQVPKQQLTEMYGKPGFKAFYCSCSGRQIMLLQCPDCDFVCNNLFGMELHIAAQRHAESRAKAAASDVLKYGDEPGSTSHQYDQELQDDGHDETMSQSSIDTQSADMDTDVNSPRNSREESHQESDNYPSPSRHYLQDSWSKSPSVISTGSSNARRDSLTRGTTPNLSSSPFSPGKERSGPLDLSGECEKEMIQERWRKSVVVSHSRGSITEGTPLDLSGYGRPGGFGGKDIPTSEALYVQSHKLGNIGSVLEKQQPLDLTPNSTHGPWSDNNSHSRPSSVQSNSSLGSLGNILERPPPMPPTIDLSRFQSNTLSNSSNKSWPFSQPSTYVPPPSKITTNPFLALSMQHAARSSKHGKEAKSGDTPSSKTSNKDIMTSVPPMLNIPAGVAAASTISRPPSSQSRTATPISPSNMPTTELTRAPPGLANLGVSPQRMIPYQGGTISIQPSDAHPPVHSRTVLFSGGEPQTPEPPQIRIKSEPVDSDEPRPCASNGQIDEQDPIRSSPGVLSSPGENSSEFDRSQAIRSPMSRRALSSPHDSTRENDRTSQELQPSKKQLAPPIVIKQEVTSAN